MFFKTFVFTLWRFLLWVLVYLVKLNNTHLKKKTLFENKDLETEPT